MSNDQQTKREIHQLHPCRVYKAVGFDDEDLQRPTIGIANAFSDMVAGHTNLRQLAEFVVYDTLNLPKKSVRIP